MVKEIANDSQATEDRLTPIDMFRKGKNKLIIGLALTVLCA